MPKSPGVPYLVNILTATEISEGAVYYRLKLLFNILLEFWNNFQYDLDQLILLWIHRYRIKKFWIRNTGYSQSKESETYGTGNILFSCSRTGSGSGEDGFKNKHICRRFKQLDTMKRKLSWSAGAVWLWGAVSKVEKNLRSIMDYLLPRPGSNRRLDETASELEADASQLICRLFGTSTANVS